MNYQKVSIAEAVNLLYGLARKYTERLHFLHGLESPIYTFKEEDGIVTGAIQGQDGKEIAKVSSDWKTAEIKEYQVRFFFDRLNAQALAILLEKSPH